MNSRQLMFLENDLASLFNSTNPLPELRNKKIFLSGAAGYVGQWLILSFNFLNKNYGHNIGVEATSRRLPSPEFMGYLSGDKNIRFYEVDVRGSFLIPSDTDFVIHLAGSPDRREHASVPLEVISTIVNGTENLFRACTRIGNITRILNFTSGHSLGKMQVDGEAKIYSAPDCLNFGASYSESKRLSETLSHIYKSQFHLPISIVRPYSFVGPLQLLERPWAINNFIRDALHRGRIKVLGNPDTLKSYLYPTDMVDWVLRYLVSKDELPPLQLGASELISLSGSALCIAEAASKAVSIEFSDMKKTQVRQDFYPEQLNPQFVQSLNFVQMITKTIEWFRLSN